MNLSALLEYFDQRGLVAKADESANALSFDGLAGLSEASPTELSFFSDRKRLKELQATQAAAVFIREEDASEAPCLTILVDDPYYAYAIASQFLHPFDISPGIHSTAVIHPDAQISEGCQIDAYAVIEAGVHIGAGSWVGSHTFVGKDTLIGNNTHLYPHVTVMHDCEIGSSVSIESGTVIGGQGFGFAPHEGGWHRIPQVGQVIIHDRVWIGNNCTIDRGALNNTEIGENTIIDNMVHLAHNVIVGKECAIVSQVGISGSVTIGNRCVLAGQAGTAGHLSLADNVHLLARTGVTSSITKPGAYGGFPHQPAGEWQKTMARTQRLDKTAQKIKQLEKELQELKKQLED